MLRGPQFYLDKTAGEFRDGVKGTYQQGSFKKNPSSLSFGNVEREQLIRQLLATRTSKNGKSNVATGLGVPNNSSSYFLSRTDGASKLISPETMINLGDQLLLRAAKQSGLQSAQKSPNLSFHAENNRS